MVSAHTTFGPDGVFVETRLQPVEKTLEGLIYGVSETGSQRGDSYTLFDINGLSRDHVCAAIGTYRGRFSVDSLLCYSVAEGVPSLLPSHWDIVSFDEVSSHLGLLGLPMSDSPKYVILPAS